MAQSNSGIASDCNPRVSPSSFPAASAAPAPSPNNSNTTTNSNNSNNNHTHNHRTSPLPDTYAALASSVASFLAVSIHQILYLRAIYPQPTFLPVRHFNHPVRQSRHPKVCTWVTDACAAVEAQLLKCSVAAVSVVILSARTNRPLERYTFDMTQMPEVPASDIHTPFENSSSADQQEQQQQQPQSTTKPQTNPPPTPIDLEAQFRAVLARLASACARLTPLPRDEEYTPTLHIVLRNNADSPAGVTKEEQLWIAAEPGRKADLNDANSNNNNSTNNNKTTRYLNPTSAGTDSDNDNSFDNNHTAARNGSGGMDGNRRGSRGRAKTVPVRTVDAGELKLEVWVEEAKGKFEELDRIRAEHPP
ncbi:mitotic spindle assembly checkpoint protein MAD2B [Blastomyces parvus]|uniref:Mitotic spindle assembly checkpoint protein MAD2B n=1 Tax=Blastomyces parvus TaxID=2060905 RepID=A0A2B7XE31_9EURO|nr:mitotic spindle assembly checkpoint protein MAD2B [Blastomyces parvus]